MIETHELVAKWLDSGTPSGPSVARRFLKYRYQNIDQIVREVAYDDLVVGGIVQAFVG